MAMSSLFLRSVQQKCSVQLAQAMRRLPADSEQGVTLVECLVAIAALALAGAMIAPPLFVTAATRLQNQRAEQAMQIAQGEIDRVRFLVERGRHYPASLPSISPSSTLSDTPAPTGFSQYIVSPNTSASCLNQFNSPTTPAYPTALPADKAIKVDVNGDCKEDFMMQVIRTAGVTTPVSVTNGRPKEFDILVRVYASPAFDNFGGLGIKPASLQFTNGEGNQRVLPLAVLSTKVYWSDKNFSICSFQRSRPQGCPFDN
jgi:type II secretory pathway pseudopilin PulG